MTNAAQWPDRLTTAALPLSFLGSGFLNILVFPLGLHHYDAARKLIAFGILGAAALFLFVRVALLYAKAPELRRPVLAAFLIPVLFGAVYLWALAVQADKVFILKQALVQGCYLVSAWSALILILAEKRLRSFLRACRICALILSPIILFYCVRYFIPRALESPAEARRRVAYLGTMDYMSLAYTLFPLCLFLMMEMFLYGGDAREKKKRVFLAQNIALFVLFSSAIALSGTKGTILCLAAGSCLLPVYARLVKQRRRIIRAYVLLAMLPVLLFSTVLYPPSLGESRSVAFFNELFTQPSDALDSALDNASGVVGETAERGFAPADAVFLAGGASEKAPLPSLSDIFAVQDYVDSGQLQADLASGRITREKADAFLRVYDIMAYTSTGIRAYLFRHAFQEIKSAPLTGQGPFFFQEKYGTYPHNFFLELAADFGLPVTLLVLALGLYVFARLIRFSMENAPVGMLLLYVFSYLPQLLVSGTLYNYSPFFQYGSCALLALYIIPLVKKQDPALWEGGAPQRLPLTK